MILTSKFWNKICICCLPVIGSCSLATPMQEQVDDVLFFFVEKIAQYRQSEAGELTFEDHSFVAAAFGTGKGKIDSASVTLPGNKGEFALEDAGRMHAFGNDRFASIEALNAEFPNGTYRVSIKSEHNDIVGLPLDLRGKGRADDYPPAPTVEISQGGVKVGWNRVDPAKDLTLGWTPFATGKADPRKVLDDMIVVLTDDCRGQVVGSSGLPFTDRYLTFRDDSYTIKAGTLKPGVPYTFRVEHIRNADTTKKGNVPGLAVYLAITTVTVNTTGEAADAACSAALADSPVGGDLETGKAKAAACTACHGPRGNSTNPLWPHLAGQSEAYIVSQLRAFKDGSRADPLMAGQVASLSEQDMKDIAVYFFNQKPLTGAAGPAPVEAGETVYRIGNAESGVPACKDCHGPSGVGNAAAAYLRLAGQHADYVATQLRIYRDGKRQGSADAKTMSAMAARLTDEEIVAVASYLSGLQ